MQFLTDFADEAVILPGTVAVLVAFFLIRWWKGALAWVCTITATLAVMLLLKLSLQTCGTLAPTWMPANPSGHVASATVVYGGLAVIGLEAPTSGLLVAFLLALLVAVTRVSLGAHSTADVIAGGLAGIVGAFCMSRIAGAPPRARRWLPVLLILPLAFGLHGLHLNAEDTIHAIAARLRSQLPSCVASLSPAIISKSASD